METYLLFQFQKKILGHRGTGNNGIENGIEINDVGNSHNAPKSSIDLNKMWKNKAIGVDDKFIAKRDGKGRRGPSSFQPLAASLRLLLS
jgi:hypothetical protein